MNSLEKRDFCRRAALLSFMMIFCAYVLHTFFDFNNGGVFFGLPNWAWGVYAASAIFVVLTLLNEDSPRLGPLYFVLQLPIAAMVTGSGDSELVQRTIPLFGWMGLLSAAGAALNVCLPRRLRLRIARY